MKIGIFTSSAPAGFYFPNRAKRAIEYLKNKGNKIILGDLFYKKDGYRTGSIKQRAKEINDLVKEPIDLLLASYGGQDTNSILPYLDYDLINKNVKYISGFSDISNLLSAISQKCPNVKVIYGPSLFSNFGEFEKESNDFSYDSLLQAISGKEHEIKHASFYYKDNKNWEFYQEPRIKMNIDWKTCNINNTENVSGVLKGGDLSTLMAIWGSEYCFNFEKGDILFIELTNKDAAQVERYFSFLKLNNVFDKCSAIILGTFHNYDNQGSKYTPIEILKEVINNPNIPILYDVNVSHDKPMASLVLNEKTTIDFANKNIIQ